MAAAAGFVVSAATSTPVVPAASADEVGAAGGPGCTRLCTPSGGGAARLSHP